MTVRGAMAASRAGTALHDLDVQDAVAALARNHHAEEEQRRPPAADLADRARRVATEVDPTVLMMLPMVGGRPLSKEYRTEGGVLYAGGRAGPEIGVSDRGAARRRRVRCELTGSSNGPIARPFLGS